METIGAVIKDGVVVNTVVWGDSLPQQLPDFLVIKLEPNVRAGIGYTYSDVDGFRPAAPYPSWLWNNDVWEPPTPMPEPDEDNPEPYEWDEETLSWVVPQWWIDQQTELEQQDDGKA